MMIRIKITDIPVEGRRQLLQALLPVLSHNVVEPEHFVDGYVNFWYLTKKQPFGNNPINVFINYSREPHHGDTCIDAGDFL